jgi:hypothetical protein
VLLPAGGLRRRRAGEEVGAAVQVGDEKAAHLGLRTPVTFACIALWQAEHVVEWSLTAPPLAFTAIRMLLWGTLAGAAGAHLLRRRAHPEI